MTRTFYDILVPHGAPREQWLEARHVGIGASEAAAVLGDSAWGTPLSVYLEKTNHVNRVIENDRMKWGSRLEPLIAQWSQEDYPEAGTVLPTLGLLRSAEWPWLLATLDYRVRFEDGTTGPFEVKNPDANEKRKWLTDDGVLMVPKPYQVQVQQQMAVDGSERALVQPFFGNNDLPEPIAVERDDDFINEFLVGELGDFWRFNVEAGIPPKATFGDRLWDLWPGDRGRIIDATPDIIDAVGRWRIAIADQKAAEDEKKQAAFEIAVFMGDATELRDPERNVIIHTLRGQHTPRTVDFDRLFNEFPDAYDATVRPKGWTRVHRATKAEI